MMNERNIRWAFNVSKWDPSPAELIRCITCIQSEEKDRIGRFFFKNDFKSSLVGRLLMRKLVVALTNIPYNEVRFGRNDKGKPILVNPDLQNIKFNISHQGDFVVLAGSNKIEAIGVDVMKMEYKGGKALKEFFRLMNKQFSHYEWDMIRRGSELEQIRMFHRHWCLKESYVKAVGVGITVNLQNISFKVHKPSLTLKGIVNDTELYLGGIKQDWEFHEVLLDENHCATIALKGLNIEKIPFDEICIQELLQGNLPILEEDVEYCNEYFKKKEKL